MCGICGYCSNKEISESELEMMNNTMYHRGPNDAGVWEDITENQAVGLAQRRLAILDLSELGHQPMLSPDGNVAVTYNGEIYNYRELRAELKEKGYQFKSECDTEVLIAAYQEWGCDCFKRLNGMFAAAIYDKAEDRIILVRDRLGKKPLYYYHENEDFVFASELKPIMKFPRFSKRINKEMIGKFLCNKYIEAPFSIFENTYKLIPGTYIIYQNNAVKTEYYWDILKQKELGDKNQFPDEEQALKEMDELLQDATARRLIADVPVGTFLSGGIDSALITAMTQKVSDAQVQSFSIGFHEKERNEAEFAAAIASHIGTKHKELYIGEKEILEMIEDLPKYYDEPFSDSSELPTMLVSKMASQDITVALTGDGGDELFCGYKMYDWAYIAQKVDWMGSLASHIPGMNMLAESLPPEIRALLRNRDEDFKTQLFIDVMVEEADKLLGMPCRHIKFDYEKKLKFADWQERRMLLDMMTYLPDEVLAKTDRASMKYSLEVRCPLLDYRFVEQSFRIPQSLKYHNRNKKYILKQLTYKYVPQALLDRPKMGFGVPLRKWLRTVLKDEIHRYADQEILKKQDIFVPEAVERLIWKQQKSDKIMYSSMLWSFYMFQLWYQRYIEDLWE